MIFICTFDLKLSVKLLEQKEIENRLNTLGIEYKPFIYKGGNKTRIDFKCINCGKWKNSTYNQIIKGYIKCLSCVAYKRNETNKHSQKYVENLLDQKKILYKPFVYIGKDMYICVKCSLCNNYTNKKLSNIKSFGNVPCKRCQKFTSKPENELKDYIISLGFNIIENDKKIMGYKQEIDILIPNLNIAFEFNGRYWHSYQMLYQKYKARKNINQHKINFLKRYPYLSSYFDNKTDYIEVFAKNYELFKTLICENKGIKLFHIYEIDWIKDKNEVKQKIKNILCST